MEEETLITIMATLIVLASFISIALSKLKLPSLVGFLVAGIIIANYVDMPEGSEDVISTFSNLGLIMLMFAIGMEIDLKKMKTQGKFAVLIAIVQIPTMLFVGMIAGSAMGFGSVQAITFGAILSGASTAVVLAVLKTNNVLDQSKMDILVLVMIIEDISQVIMISVLTPMMKGDSMSTDALIVLIINIVIFMLLCFTLGLKIVPRILDWVYERTNDELISLLCVGILFVFALLANLSGLSVAIGAFLCGVMVGMSRPKHIVEHYIEPLKSLFMAMFFISVGMEVSVDSLADNIPMIIAIYLLFASFMFIAVNIGYWVANGNPLAGWISAASMCTMGEFAFIISKQALDYNLFDQSLYSSIVGAAIVSMFLLPFLVGSAEKTYNAIGKVCPGPLKNAAGFLTTERDLMYRGLTFASRRSKERFRKALTNAMFLMLIIVVIECVFFFAYDPVSEWLTNNFGSDVHTWKLIILFINIVVLLDPCMRLARFLRFTFYFVEKGKKQLSAWNRDEDLPPNFFENFSSLAVGAALTIVIVILVPNGIDNFTHIILLLVALVLVVLLQIHKYKSGVPNAADADVPAEAIELSSEKKKDDVQKGSESEIRDE